MAEVGSTNPIICSILIFLGWKGGNIMFNIIDHLFIAKVNNIIHVDISGLFAR